MIPFILSSEITIVTPEPRIHASILASAAAAVKVGLSPSKKKKVLFASMKAL